MQRSQEDLQDLKTVNFSVDLESKIAFVHMKFKANMHMGSKLTIPFSTSAQLYMCSQSDDKLECLYIHMPNSCAL